MRWNKALIFVLFFITGVTLGGLLTMLCGKVEFLSWLTFGQAIGVGIPDPITLDLSVIKLSFGFGFDINIIKMISIIFCLWLYKKFAKGL